MPRPKGSKNGVRAEKKPKVSPKERTARGWTPERRALMSRRQKAIVEQKWQEMTLEEKTTLVFNQRYRMNLERFVRMGMSDNEIQEVMEAKRNAYRETLRAKHHSAENDQDRGDSGTDL
jgi:hypothetical protein